MNHLKRRTRPALLSALRSNTSGNTLAIVAAAIAPLMAMVGGGVDLGRTYLAQSRLQQACDAGVLAARKRIGTEIAVTGTVPTDAAEAGNRFFNINFQNESYGTRDRNFVMTLQEDYGVRGTASVNVPTTIMAIFGHKVVPVSVTCESNLTMANTDIMLVVDVTGSMRETNSGDTEPRIDILKSTVKSFHAQLAAATSDQTRIRYGFVPYSTNVNVGAVLQDDWVVDEWTYQSREQIVEGQQVSHKTVYKNWTTISGTRSPSTVYDSFPATYNPPADETSVGTYDCSAQSAPNNTLVVEDELLSTTTEEHVDPPGEKTIKEYRRTSTGEKYWISRSGETCNIYQQSHDNFVEEYQTERYPYYKDILKWRYKPLSMDVSDWRSSSNGCMEERETYEIADYSNVDLSKALDLDIDAVPDAADPATQWRPMFPGVVYARALSWNATGSFSKPTKVTASNYLNPGSGGFAACPAPVKKLTKFTAAELDTYLATLQPNGSTYHDIGMIWGGRLLSPTGLFASENADVSAAKPTERHLIFLTDGETSPLDVSYSSYGVEPLDARRWDEKSSLSLSETVEKRFGVACAEVKKRNITVWVIGFGTDLNPVMIDCAGEGHAFEAEDAAQLTDTFATIAAELGNLRITR